MPTNPAPKPSSKPSKPADDQARAESRDGQSTHSPASRTVGDPAKIRTLAIEAARLCSDDKCTDVVVLDVREISQVTDYIVIGTGTSDRQMRSVLDHIEDVGKGLGFPAYRVSRDDRSVWLLADFVDVVVHLFEPNARAHYDIEMLWGDAPKLEWKRPASPKQGAAEPRA